MSGKELATTMADGLPQVLTKAQETFLLQRTPPEEVKTRQGRGGMVMKYVEHSYVTELLNNVFGFDWDFEITDKQILEDEVLVQARLTVRTLDGRTITKTQFGGADIKRFGSGPKSGKPLSIADDYKAAGSDALKKCGSLLGIALDLYGRDYSDPEPEPQATVIQGMPVIDMPARVLAATKEQVETIEDLVAHLEGWTVARVAQQMEVGALWELTQSKAARVIARLRELSEPPAQTAVPSETPILDAAIAASDRVPMEPGKKGAKKVEAVASTPTH